MILRRLVNKSKISKEIQKHFPPHKIYIEPFFGAGGMFFNKPKAKYNIVNDLDSDVFNLFMVVMNQKDELEKGFYQMPIHSDLLNYWKKHTETDPIKKALRFLFLSNFCNPMTGDIKQVAYQNHKSEVADYLTPTYKLINDIQFSNKDFRIFLKHLYWNPARPMEKKNTFIYCDPPYLRTKDNYSNSFKEQDSIDLFDCLEATGCKFAMSEFDNPFILNQAKERGLNVIIIGERQNLKNRRTEILITNYQKNKNLFD